MAEPWLRSNPRVALFGAVPLGIITLIGVILTRGGFGHPPAVAVRTIGYALVFAAGLALALWWFVARLPRISHRDGYLLVYLRLSRPIRVPIEAIECFFMGQGPDPVVGRLGKETMETINVVMRLAERSREWREVKVNPLLGYWCDGYATIRGAWCERLSTDLVTELNHRLMHAKRVPPSAARSHEERE